MTHDKALHIPWLNYIKVCLEEVGRTELFTKPEIIVRKDVNLVRKAFFNT